MNKIRCAIKKIIEYSAETYYLLALLIFLTAENLSTTMFGVSGKTQLLLRLLAILIVVLKILLKDRYSKKGFLYLFLFMICLAMIYVKSGYMEPLFWGIMVVGAKDISWKKIMQIYLLDGVAIVGLAFIASMLGVITNLQYEVDGLLHIRNSFGIMYPTDFASHVFFLLLVAFVLFWDKLKPVHFVLGFVLATVVFLLCITRLDVGCMYIMLIGFVVLRYYDSAKYQRSIKAKYKVKKKSYIWCAGIMPVAAIFMYGLTYCYTASSQFFCKLDEMLSMRLYYGKMGLTEYKYTLFGQYVDMVGNGGSVGPQLKDYFFVDCSYLYILLRYGGIFLLIVLGIFIKINRKHCSEKYFLWALVLVAINCMIAHHIIELAYNPFALALLADFGEGPLKKSSDGNHRWEKKNQLS